jgi:hypothetical protein
VRSTAQNPLCSSVALTRPPRGRDEGRAASCGKDEEEIVDLKMALHVKVNLRNSCRFIGTRWLAIFMGLPRG